MSSTQYHRNTKVSSMFPFNLNKIPSAIGPIAAGLTVVTALLFNVYRYPASGISIVISFSLVLSVLLGGLKSGIVSAIIASCYYFYILLNYHYNSIIFPIVNLMGVFCIVFLTNYLSKNRTNKTFCCPNHYHQLHDPKTIYPVAVVYTALDGRILTAPPTLCHLLGYSEEELLKLNSKDISHPEDVETDWNNRQKLVDGEIDSFDMAKRYLRKDGETVWLYICVTIVRNPEGKPVHFLCYIHDLTESKRTEKALIESEKKYRELFNNANDAVTIHLLSDEGIPGKFIEVNDIACKTLGYSREEFLSMTPLDIASSKLHPAIIETGKELLEKNHSTYERIYLTKKGNNVPVEVSAHVFFMEDKRVVLSISRDITERKVTEEALLQSEERYRRLVELSPEAIVVHSGGKFVFSNSAGLRLIGLKNHKELIGHSILKFLHPDYHKIALERVRDLYRSEGSAPFIHQKLIRSDNTIVDVEIASTFMYYEGKPSNMVVVHDMTERKRVKELQKNIEENTKLLNEALEYDKLKTEFFSNISHELRTPLNLILSTLQLINLYLPNSIVDSNEDKVNRHLGIVKQNCYRLLRLVNNLIDITRIDSGFFDIVLQNYNIVSIVEEVILSVKEYVENKSLTLSFNSEIDEKVIACNPDMIERIMLNLLSNAVKFTKPGGHVSVNIYDKNESIVITVEDTGIGIPKDKLGIIFERFRQVDKSFTRSHEGSGIGLCLVKSLVEMHEGNIFVKSKEGKGSKFTIGLPVKTVSFNIPALLSDAVQSNNIGTIDIEFSDIYSHTHKVNN